TGVRYSRPVFRPTYVRMPNPGSHPANNRATGLTTWTTKGRRNASLVLPVTGRFAFPLSNMAPYPTVSAAYLYSPNPAACIIWRSQEISHVYCRPGMHLFFPLALG